MDHRSSSPRVAVFSLRKLEKHVSRSHGYEFEDTIADSLDDATIISPTPTRHSRGLIKAKRFCSARTKLARFLPSGLESTEIDEEVDLFFFSIAHLEDLNFLSSLKGWRKKSKFAVCWIQELWLRRVAEAPSLVSLLNQFDHVICSFSDTTDELRELLDVPVQYLPWGVDMVHFCPYPGPPQRTIDVLSIGARHPVTHEALVEFTDRTGLFYSYETISGRASMQDYKAHRHNYVSQLKRARYFFSYVAKVETTKERGKQVEFGLRYLEGAAAGAVVLGDRIDSEGFNQYLGWSDAVVDVPYESENIGDLIAALDGDPERLDEISRRNVVECLKSHDHMHRWQAVLDIAGLEPDPKMKTRETALANRINLITSADRKTSVAS